MTKVKRYKKETSSWKMHSLSSSWIPLTFALLLYTSGIHISIGGESSAAASNRDPPPEDETEQIVNKTSKKNYTLTGNPQIDYIHDPNLPHELNGYNLSDYPFLSRVPVRINFSCEGLKDGFYANVEHKCQVYHHCVSGFTRYDFLCANFTAFDQKTFICQFVSVVDCPNSALFWHRNDDLYWETKTTESTPINIRRDLYERRRPPPKNRAGGLALDREAPSPPLADPVAAPAPAEDPGDPYYDSEEDYRPVRRKPARRRCKNKRRCRANRRRRPRPRRPTDYYDDYDEEYEADDYEDDDYYEDDHRPKPRGRRRKDKNGNRVVAGSKLEEAVLTEKPRARGTTTLGPTMAPTTTPTTTTTSTQSPFEEVAEQEKLELEQSKSRDEILSKPRPPRIRKYEFTPQGRSAAPGAKVTSTTTTTSTTPPPVKPGQEDVGDDYYYETEDEKQSVASPPTKPTPKPKPTPPTTISSRQRFISRNFRQNPATAKASASSSTTSTTTTTTTPKPTTPPPPPTTQRSQRVTLRSQYVPSTTPSTTPLPTTSVTTTTTELPQYEYEYEYEDEAVPIPSSSQVPLVSSNSIATTVKVTTTTPTTSTTAKPSRPSPLRGNKRPGPVQTSTSVSIQEQEGPEELDDSQNAINRRQSSWGRGQPGSQSKTPVPGTPPPTPPSHSVASSTSERVSQGRGNRQQQIPYQPESPRPVITVKSQSPITPPQQFQSQSGGGRPGSSTETAVVKNRPSRFWQRPTKVVASSSTTEVPLEYDYSDADDVSESPPPPPPRYNAPQTGSRFKSTSPGLVPSSTSSYTEPPPAKVARGQYSSTTNSQPQQYLRSTISQAPNPGPYRGQGSNTNYISQYGPSPSSIGIQYQHQLPSTSAPHSGSSSPRPEFISLLRDDEDMEDPYAPYDMEDVRSSPSSSLDNNYNRNSNYNQNRRLPVPTRTQYFGGTGPSGGGFVSSQKNLYGAAQETYHSFLPPPSRFNFMSGMADFGPPPSSVILYRGGYPRAGKK